MVILHVPFLVVIVAVFTFFADGVVGVALYVVIVDVVVAVVGICYHFCVFSCA